MSPPMDFDFDLMARLAKENPAEFARRREELIRNFIENSSNPEKGHRIQFQIDMERMRTAPGEQTYLAMARRLTFLLKRMSDLFGDIQTIARQHKMADLPVKQP
ncbi:MAG: hypothetical protein H6R10_2233 [Rhodocyclaceae bacterium]|nr:hypothetical protein [Rhodocyclaceae bacterium]